MKNRYWAVTLCVVVLVLALLSACGGPKATTTATSSATGTPTATATTTQTPTATGTTTQTATATTTQTGAATTTQTATATATATSTQTQPPTTTAGGDSLTDILGQGATFNSIYFEMVVINPDQSTYSAKMWMKNQTKIRQEMSMEGANTIIIINMGEGKMWMYYPDQNMAMEMEMDTEMVPEDIVDPGEILDYNPNIEGTEYIDGKECIVITWDISGMGTTKSWIWVDYGFPIRTETTTSAGTTIIEYKNLDFSDIPDSMFELPEGVTIIPMGTDIPEF
jgi:predicted flap endonuclease-1-like 5' DNA nuclease